MEQGKPAQLMNAILALFITIALLPLASAQDTEIVQ
jgi:hypothetical protein